MTIYYLMIKTHNITGLKYLCQTKQKDPLKYTGSGVDWKEHLLRYGRNFTTVIIHASSNKEAINLLGRQLSKQWRITTSVDDYGNRIWANRIDETGAGGGTTSASATLRYINNPSLLGKFKKKMAEPDIAAKRKISRALTVSSGEFKEKFKETMKTAANRPEVKLNNSVAQRAAQNRPEVKLRNSIAQTEAQNRPEVVLKKQLSGLIAQNRPETLAKKSRENHYRFDPTIYEFIHTSGNSFIGTAYSFCETYQLDRGWLSNVLLGNRKSIKGWLVTQST